MLSVGHGRKSDPHDAVSVAATARSVPSLRLVGVDDQAVVLHLLINRLHRLLLDLVPGGARRNLTVKRAAARCDGIPHAGTNVAGSGDRSRATAPGAG
jgi:transposase